MRTLAVAAALLPLVLGACDTRPRWARETLGREYFDDSGEHPHAGVSTRVRAAIEPLDPRHLDRDTVRPVFGLYRKRCGACHEVPDPTMKTAEHWSFMIGRMKEKTRTAGLLPMTDQEADSILAFLQEHAPR